jgi:hypothetical protein
MEFAPYHVYTPSTMDPAGDEDEDEGETERLYTEMATGNWWWRTQVSKAL